MSKLIHFQSDFTSGEISPKLLARTDLKAYDNALKTMINAYPMPHGGAKRRPGSVFIGEVSNSAEHGRLIPFIYSKSSSYVLVFNDGKIQFVKDGQFIMNGPVRYEISSPYLESELDDITFAQTGNALYIAHQNHIPRIIQRTSDTNWTMTAPVITYKALSDQWYQNDYIKFKIISGVSQFLVGHKFRFAVSALGVIDYFPTAVNDSFVTKTATAYTGYLSSNDSKSNDSGNTWTVLVGPTHGTVAITSTTGAFTYTSAAAYVGADSFTYTMTDADGDTSTATVSVDVVAITTATSDSLSNIGALTGVAVTNTIAAQTWTVTCVSSTSSRQEWVVSGSASATPPLTWNTGKYPGAVGFFEQRLYFASTPAEPQTIWGSAINDFTNFTLGPNNDDAVEFTFASNRYDQVVHLESARQLVAMSVGGEFSLVGGTAGITPSSVRIRANTFHGSAAAKPIRISQEVVFLQRDRKKVRAISYSVAEDTNLATDLTLFAEHITGTGLLDMTFTQDPDYLLWATRDDGMMVSMTHLREQGVTGWARHQTQGSFENCTSVPEGQADQTYLIVNRTINGANKRYVEVLDYTNGAMTDASMTGYNATKTATWSGCAHLEGMSVTIVADGVPHGNRTVTGGAITLDYPVNKVEIGLGYTTTLEMLHPAEQLPDGSSHARKVSIPQITLMFQDTVSCTVNGYALPFRTNLIPLGSPTPPFTGEKQVQLLGWNSPQVIRIEQKQPSQMTVLGIAMKMIVPDLTE